ncbi:cytochrome P450, partial [Conidiobolus coronatus NRRL 28638]
YELLKHPEFYKLVADEIIEKFPNVNEPINSQDAKKELKYLEAAVLESTRMHPAGADILPREVPEEGLTINEYYLPPKTVFALDIYCEHNDPKFWENPREYDINRWLEDREAKKAKLVGFGLGPRSCIGRDLAWNEILLVLANLIRHFNFELVD